MDQYSAAPLQGQIYTLAQNGTSPQGNSSIIVSGKGSQLSNTKALRGRAKRKLITQTMMLSLIDASDIYRTEKTKKSYWNTYHCQSRIFTANGRLYGKYCKNRFCTLCCSIRKAQIINSYLPVIQTWDEPYFVTLTIRSIKKQSLSKFIKGMNIAFNKIYTKLKKRYQRKTGIKFMGIRSLECNFNNEKRTYNPHFHIVVSGKEAAETLIEEWLRLWTPKWTSREAQDSRPADNTETLLIEIIKYGSKIFTEPDLKRKTATKKNSKIYIAALDNIFNAMKGIRIFERFGFNHSPGVNNRIPAKVIREYLEWEYSLTDHDWTNNQGEKLSNFTPLKELLCLIENNIDTTLQ